MNYYFTKEKGMLDKISDPTLPKATDDEIVQAQHKLSGLCPNCGAEGKEKYSGRCVPCMIHHKNHPKKKKA